MVRETRHLWVGNLPENINEDRIREHFKRYGPVQSVKFLSGGVSDEGVCAAVAFVDICSAAKAHKADHRIEERLLKTTYYEPSVTAINATHYPSSGSGIHRDSSHYTPTPTQPNSHLPHGARSPRFSTGLNEDHNSYERSSHFYESRRDESIGYNGLGGATLSASSGIAGVPGGMRRTYPVDRDSDFSNNGRGRVRAYPPRGHFLTNGRAEPGEYRWNNSGQYRYHSEAYTEEKIRRSQGSSPPPITRSAIRGSRQTIPSSKRRLPTSRSGTESPSSSRSSRSSCSSSSSSSSSRSSSSRSGSLGHSSRSNSRSPRRVGNPSQVLSVPILSSPSEKRACAICVKNLPPWSSDNSLKDGLFHDYKKHGKVTLVRIFGSGSERYAIVCFKKSEDTEKALDASQDKQFFGVKIQVSPHEGLELDENEFRTAYDVELDEYHPKATRTLFIGGLDKEITVSELRTHFEPFGEIIEIDIKKQNSSTFAFCQYSDIRSVVLAVKKMDGEHLGCNRIKLGFGKSMPNRCIWVGGISDALTDTVLCEHFSRFGTITHRNINREKGHALIAYESERHASLAVTEMRGCVLSGKKLQIDFASRECQEAFFDNLKKQEYLSPSESRSWERRDVEKFERQRRGDGTFIARQISTQRVPSFTSTRSRSRYDSFEEFTTGRNFDEFADDSFERDLHEYAGRQRFENGTGPPTTIGVTAATTTTPTTTTTTTTSTIKHRGFSPIRKREERSPHSPRSLVREPESLSPLIRPFEEHESRKTVRNRSTSDQESFHSQSPPPNKLTSPRGRTSSSRMPSHSPSTPHATSPSREITLMEDRNLVDPRRRRPSEYKDLVVRVSDLRRPSESPIRLRGAQRIPSDMDIEDSELYSSKSDIHDPRLLRRDDPISSGDERSLDGERPLKKSKYSESSAGLFDKTHSIKRSVDNYDYRPRDQSPSFRKPFESRKNLDKFKKDTNRSNLSDDHIRSPPTDPRQRKTSQSGGSDVDETTSWRSRESYVPVTCDAEFLSDASPPGTPVRDEREDPPSDPVNRRPHLNHSYFPHREKVHCSPLSLPLPKFAQQFRIHLSPRGASSSPRAAAMLRSPTFNNTTSSFNTISLEVNQSIEEADPILADTPVSPGPAVHDTPSDSEESATVSPTNTAVDLYERIRALDEKYEKWTGNSRTVGKVSVTPRPNTVHEIVSKVSVSRKKRIMNIDELRSQEPSAIVKSLLSKRSVFDEDSERLENVSDKYEPKPFTSVSKPKVGGNLSSTISCSLQTTTATTTTHLSTVSISTVLPVPSATPLSSLPGIRVTRPSNSPTSVSGPLVIKSNTSSVQNTIISSFTTSTSSLSKSIEGSVTSTLSGNLAQIPYPVVTCHNATSSLSCSVNSDVPLSSDTSRNLILNTPNISKNIDERETAFESVITVSLDTRPTGTDPVVQSSESKLITTNSVNLPNSSTLPPHLLSPNTSIPLSANNTVSNIQSISSIIATDTTTFTAQHDLSLKVKCDKILHKDFSNATIPLVNCENSILSVKQPTPNVEQICKELMLDSKLKINNHNNLNKIETFQSKVKSESSNNYIPHVEKKASVPQNIHKRRLSSTNDTSIIEKRRSSRDSFSSEKMVEPDTKKFKLDLEEKENKSHHHKGGISENMLEKNETVKINSTESLKVNKSEAIYENASTINREFKSESVKENKSESIKESKSDSRPIKENTSETMKSAKESKVDCIKENKSESVKENKSVSIKENKADSNREHKSESNREHKSESNKEHKSESNKEHKSESNKEHKSESNKEHKPESNKDHKPESVREKETESFKDNKSASCKENKSETGQETIHKFIKENKSENKFEISNESRFATRKEKTEISKENKYVISKDNKCEIRKENKFDIRKENKSEIRKEKSEICKEINFEIDISGAENKLDIKKDNKFDSFNEIGMTKESSKFHAFKENKSDCKENKFAPSKDSKSEMCKDKHETNNENSKEFKFVTNKENKSVTNKENKYDTKLRDKSDIRITKESKHEVGKESSKESKHDINKENKDNVHKSERKGKVRYNKKEDEVIDEKGVNVLNVESVLAESRLKKNIEEKQESLERLTGRLSSRVEVKEEKKEKDKRKDKYDDKCTDKFSQKAIQYEKIKSDDLSADKKVDLKKELKEEMTEEHGDDKRSEDKIKKDDKEKCKSDYDRKRHSDSSKNRMERKERNRIRKEKVRERDKHRSSFSHSDKDLEREKKEKSRSEKSKDKARYKAINADDRIRHYSGKHQERKELKEAPSVLSSPTEICSPNNYFDRPIKKNHSKQSKSNSQSLIEHDDDFDGLGNSPNFSKPQQHVSCRFKELSEKSDSEFMHDKSARDTLCKKLCSGKIDKSSDDNKSKSHSSLKPHYQKTKTLPEEDERGYKVESDEVSTDDELKIKNHPQPAKRTKQRATSSSSSSRRGRPSKNKSILDTESDSVDSDSNSETEKPKKPSYFDVTIYDGNMYDKVKARRVQSTQKQDDDAKQLEIKQKLVQHRSRRSKKALQSPSNVIASETEDSDHDVSKKRGKARINSSSEDESFSKIRPNHLSSDESDSHFHSNKQDKLKKKLTSMDNLKSSKLLPLSDITTDEDTIGLHNARNASGTESDSDPRHESKESRKIESDSEASDTGIPKPPRPALSVGRGRAKERELKANRLLEKSSHMKSNIVSEGLEYSLSSEEVRHFKPKSKSGSFELANKIYSADGGKCTEIMPRDKGRKGGRMKAIFGLMSDDSDSNASPSVPLSTSELLSTTTYRKGSSSSGTSFEPINMTPPSQVRTHSGTFESYIDDDFRLSTPDIPHQKLTPNLDSIETPNISKELNNCDLKNMKEMLHDMPIVKDTLMGSSWRESAVKEAVCDASRGASDSGKGSSSGVSTASSSSGSSAEELLLLESNASLTFREEPEVSVEKSTNKAYHFNREIDCKETIAPRKDKKKKKKHKDKDGHRLHRHSKESHQNKSHLMEESTCHIYKFNSSIESTSAKQDVVVRTPIIEDKQSHSRSSRDSIEDLPDHFIEVIKDSPPLDMPIIKPDEFEEASTVTSNSAATKEKIADTVTIKSFLPEESNGSVKNNADEKSVEIFEEVVGSMSLIDPAVKNTAETVESTTPKPSRSTISQEETLNAVAGLLACYNDYQEDSSPPQPEDEPVIHSEPEPSAPMEDPSDQSEEAQKAAQMLQSEMPEEDRENEREQSWESVPNLNSSHVESVPIQPIAETVTREPERTPIVELPPKKLLHNLTNVPELKDSTIHFPDSPSSVQSEPELQIDEDEQTDLRDAACLNDNVNKSLKTLSRSAETLVSLKVETVLQLDHTHNNLSNQALTPQSLSPALPSSCDGKIDDDCDKEKETDQPELCNEINDDKKDDISEKVLALSQSEDQNTFENSKIDKFESTVLSQSESKSEVDNNFSFHNKDTRNPIDCVDITSHNFKSETDKKEVVILNETERVENLVTCETKSEKLLTCEIKTESFETSNVKKDKITVETVNVEINEKSLDPVNVITQVEICVKENMKVECADEIKKESYESLAECMSKENENASPEAAVCKIKTNDAELYNQESVFEGPLHSLDDSKESKDNLQIELTEEVKVSPPQRGRGRGRGRRGAGRSLETTSLSPEAPMLTRSCITTRHSKTRGKGHIPLLERDNVEEKVPDQPRRSTRTKRARKHPDMVDHEETTNRRKRGGKGGRGGDDMSMRSALLRSDVYDFHDSDDEVGVSISKKGKKQTTPSRSPVKLADENTEAVIDANASPRKSRRLREKLTDDESSAILSDGDIEGEVTSGATKSRVRGRKQDEEEMASPRKSPRNRSKAGENELDNEREPLLKVETLLSEVVLLQKVEPSVSTHATSIPAVTVTPKAVIIPCPPNKPIGISTLVPSSSQSAVSLTSVPAIYSNVSSHPVKLSIVQSAMRGVSKGTPVTCVVTSQVPTTQANPNVSLLTVASLPVSTRENFVAQPNVISSPIKAVLPIKALSTSAFKAFPNGKKPDSTSTPLVDPVTGHLTPMKMLDEGHYIPIAGEHLLSSRISAEGRDKKSIASHPPAKVLRAVLPSSITVTSISNSNSNPITVVSIPSNSASLSAANRQITVAGLPKGVAVATLPRGSEVSVELVSRTRPSVIPFTSANVQMTTAKGITNFISKPQPTSHHPSHTSVNTIISSHVTATQPCSAGIVAVTTPSKMLTSNSVINNVIGSSRGAVLGVSLTHVKGPIAAKLHPMSTSTAKLVNTTQVIPTTGVILNSSSLPSTSVSTLTLQRANIVSGEYSSQLPASTTVQQTQTSIICANPASRVPTTNIPKSIEIRQQGSLQLPVPREERSSPHPYVEDQRPARQEYVALGPHRFADPRFRDMPVEVTRLSSSASGTRHLENETIPHLASRQQYDLHAGNTQIRQGARSSTSGVPLSHVQSQMTGKGGIAHFFPARDIGEIHKKPGTPQPLPHQSPHGPSGVGVERYLTSPPLHTLPSAHTPPPAHHHNTQRDGLPINPIVYHRVPYIVADPRAVPVYGEKISPMPQMPMDLKIIEKSLTGTEKSVEEKEHRPASGPKQLDIGSARPPTVITPHNAVSPHHLPSPHYERSTDSPQVTMMYTRRYPHFDPNLYPNRTGTPGMEHDNLPRSPVHMPFTPMQPTEPHHQQRIPIPGPPQYACQVPPPPPHQGENYILQEYPIMWDGMLGLKNDQALVKMHFISGSIDVARGALSSRPDGPSSLIKISQRMRLEQSQLEGVARKMQMEDEHCILMALPFGRTPYDLIQQQANLNIGFIKYLGEKRAAGIVNVFGPGSHQSAYVIHIFPPCDFADESLSRIAPELLHGIGNTSRLLVVIATC